MIIGQDKPDYYNIKLDFVQYCQVYDNTRNDTTPRSVGDIALINENDRGSYYFMSLEQGIVIHARKWTLLHLTESIIGRAEKIDAGEGINEIVDEDMLFEWKPGDPIMLQPNYKEAILPSNQPPMSNSREKWDIMSSYLGRNKDIRGAFYGNFIRFLSFEFCRRSRVQKLKKSQTK